MHPKFLFKVTVQGSVGPVQLVMSPENTVGDLSKAVLEIYVREKRRPLMADVLPGGFELHYSPFSLQSLDEDKQLIKLGSRNFFMCQKSTNNSNVTTCREQRNQNTATFSFSLIEHLMDILL
ncbi:hypothetical protein RND81_08G123400 [Saponaria officinalis]|uniref:DUF7054 domain-containing protein n=1 Tax=Saponaria officinalis TaxID=3572 RepID=A0AAW1J761_SAPOF